MTVSSTGSRSLLLGDGATTTWSCNFELPAASDLAVLIQNTDSSTSSVAAGLYTLSGVGAPTGFSLTYPTSGALLQTGQTLVAYRVVPYTQPSTFSNVGPFDATNITTALDNIVFEIQQLQDASARSVRAPVTDAAMVDLPAANLRANKYLGFDSTGQVTASGVLNTASGYMQVETASTLVTGVGTINFLNGITLADGGGGIADVTITVGTPGGSTGQIQYNAGGGTFGGFTVSGDGTLSTTGALAVTKTGGIAFASLATQAATGDVTGATNSAALALSTTGVTAGTYQVATVTVDAKGRLSAVATGSLSGSTINITDGATTVSATTASFSGAAVTNGGGGVANIAVHGGLVFLDSQTASTSATLDFTSLAGATYDTLVLDLTGLVVSTNSNDILLRMGTGGGPTWDTSSNYRWFLGENTDGSVTDFNAFSSSSTSIKIMGSAATGTGQNNGGTFYIRNVGSATQYKIVHGTGTVWNVQTVNIRSSGTYTSTTAVTGLRLFLTSGTFLTGVARLYGLAKS